MDCVDAIAVYVYLQVALGSRSPQVNLTVFDDLTQAEGFLEKGVTPGVQDKEWRTGAHFAASRGELEMLQFLHSKGVDVDAEDSTGRSPLHYAALRDHESTVVFLASKGAWVDACDATDCSPLHLAARNNAAAAAARLLHLGAKSHIRNQWHLTAIGATHRFTAIMLLQHTYEHCPHSPIVQGPAGSWRNHVNLRTGYQSVFFSSMIIVATVVVRFRQDATIHMSQGNCVLQEKRFCMAT